VIAPATFFVGEKAEAAQQFASTLTPLLRKTSGLPAGIEPDMYDANIYEIVSLFLEAVKKEGVSLQPEQLAQDREKIRRVIAESGTFMGFNGKIAFNPDGDAIKSFFVLVGQGGKWAERASGCSAPAGSGC
jgi:branched-chain amino acid transport system substrate-binding protein